MNQLMNILVGQLDGSVTLRQLAILVSVQEADLAGDSLNVSDMANPAICVQLCPGWLRG